jgi:hypothetical protein
MSSPLPHSQNDTWKSAHRQALLDVPASCGPSAEEVAIRSWGPPSDSVQSRGTNRRGRLTVTAVSGWLLAGKQLGSPRWLAQRAARQLRGNC